MTKEAISVIELFSGIGTQKRGIENSNLWEYTLTNTAEIDINAIIAYATLHCGLDTKGISTFEEYPTKQIMIAELKALNIGYDFNKKKAYNWEKVSEHKVKTCWLACKISKNLGDITRIESLAYADLWTYSFPCQDISRAGKQKGIIKGQTRSGLLYEIERLLGNAKENNKLPKYLLLENVKALASKQYKEQFEDWLNTLKTLGYNTYWKILNSKDLGIPQNRERLFAISIREDIDNARLKISGKGYRDISLQTLLDSVPDTEYTNEQLELKQGESVACLVRKLKAKESMLLTGLELKDYDLLKSISLSESSILKLMGNAIVTDCVTSLMLDLYKALVADIRILDNVQKVNKDIKYLIIDDMYKSRGLRLYSDYCPTLRAERNGLKVMKNKKGKFL